MFRNSAEQHTGAKRTAFPTAPRATQNQERRQPHHHQEQKREREREDDLMRCDETTRYGHTHTHTKHGHGRHGCHVLRQAYAHPPVPPRTSWEVRLGPNNLFTQATQNQNYVRTGCLLLVGHNFKDVLQCCVDHSHAGRGSTTSKTLHTKVQSTRPW